MFDCTVARANSLCPSHQRYHTTSRLIPHSYGPHTVRRHHLHAHRLRQGHGRNHCQRCAMVRYCTCCDKTCSMVFVLTGSANTLQYCSAHAIIQSSANRSTPSIDDRSSADSPRSSANCAAAGLSWLCSGCTQEPPAGGGVCASHRGDIDRGGDDDSAAAAAGSHGISCAATCKELKTLCQPGQTLQALAGEKDRPGMFCLRMIEDFQSGTPLLPPSIVGLVFLSQQDFGAALQTHLEGAGLQACAVDASVAGVKAR